jgi:hypothetical protein
MAAPSSPEKVRARRCQSESLIPALSALNHLVPWSLPTSICTPSAAMLTMKLEEK